MKIERVALIGAGAVGAYFIWGLAERMGEKFCVIASGERKKRLEEQGILINDTLYRLNVKTPEEAGHPDLLLVACKQEALEGMLDDIRTLVGEETIVLSLLNGVSSERIIGNVIGMEHMMYSVMRIASVRAHGKITFVPENTAGVYFGENEGIPETPRAQAVRELFESAGIRCTYVENIITDLWLKYASNTSQNLPQAILGVGFGAYKDSEHVNFISEKLWQEVVQVAGKHGVRLPEKIFAFRGVKKTARFSTLQDLDAGRHTEIETFAGEMIRMGNEYNVEVPYCEYTYHLIKAMEEKNDGKFDYS